MTIRKNLEALEQKIAEAAAKSGRRREDITLVAVSKTVGAAEVAEAYGAGQRIFAENRVQKFAGEAFLCGSIRFGTGRLAFDRDASDE